MADAESRIYHATSKDEALAATISAVELCMRQLKLASDDERKRHLSRKCEDLLQKAEQIKATERWRPAVHGERSNSLTSAPDSINAVRLKERMPNRTLSAREQIILLKGSKLYGSVFPPWISPPNPQEFELLAGETPYIDNVELKLSSQQQEIFNGWRRPDKAFPCSSIQQLDRAQESGPTMKAQARVDLVQDVTSDCSVVASLCAVSARAERGHSNVRLLITERPDFDSNQIISSIFYPYNYSLMEPLISSSGRYVLRLHFNGCFRKVTIDDRLPSSRTKQTLHVADRNHPGLLWPALIEKAYLKIRGGYDFPGSNSGTDLWVLTGWIPEQLFLQRDESSPDTLWHRVFTAFKHGDLLVTLGTGRFNEREEDEIGLVGEHDYAVIDMEETESRRSILVKNPWSEGTIWKGGLNYGSHFVDNKDYPKTQQFEDSTLSISKAGSLAPGTFWMSMNDVFQSFESMYLNWNPNLFASCEDIHFDWNLAGLRSPIGSFGSNPQFRVRSTVAGSIWVLLSRHFTTISQILGDNTNNSMPMPGIEHGFMSLNIFDSDGYKVILSDGAKLRGTYVDSPNTLAKFDLPSSKWYTVVVSEQDLPASAYSFTLSVFSLHPVIIKEAQDKYSHYTLRKGAWSSSSSGGNASSFIYHINPQFSIRLPAASDISFLLESTERFPVHVKLVWANGKAVSSITTRDIVGDTGEYRKGYAFAELSKVQAGTYTIVCSTFETGQLGPFTLRIGTMLDCIVEQVQSAEAGRLILDMPTASFAPGVNCLLAPLICDRITRVSMVARRRQSNSASMRGISSPMKLAVEYGQGPTSRVLVVSGEDEFLEIPPLIRTKDIDVSPGMCHIRGLWVVIYRVAFFGPQNDEEINVELLSDEPVKVGTWITKDD